ncbi:hypothetical protein CFD26_103067 [Aspergillus turcosus]|uniref:CENP-V/GFA domain-containing protein n=1 Tax=Aspergillus turcosus TaxID=1245748 RepID=A0A3R7HSI1_9EURO|nr:hypothetical protein CFD26_103067 [Aspergillus turcosus]
MSSNTGTISPMEGGCACGLIRYRLETRPLVVHCCHRTSCQRETGTAFALNAVIESTLVTLLPPAQPTVPGSAQGAAKPAGPVVQAEGQVEPEMILTPSESGKGQNIARCPSCHVAVWSNYSGAGPFCRFVRVGTLDEAWRVGPEVHIYTASKRGFFSLGDSIPQFEGFYPKEEVWRKESLERWDRICPEVVRYKEGLS